MESNMPYKIGDIVQMGFERQTLWQRLMNKPKKPKYYKFVTANNTPGGLSYIEECTK